MSLIAASLPMGLVDDELHVILPLGFRPTDESVSRGKFPCARAEAQQGKQSLAFEDEVGY